MQILFQIFAAVLPRKGNHRKKGEDFQATGTTKTAATPEGIAAAVFPRQRPPQSVLADPGVVHIV